MRRYHSLRSELIKKSRESMLAAVQIYNNPNITFKAEAFITLAIIGWTYLLHAYYREKKIDYRYCHQDGKRKKYDRTKYGAYKYWELERCISDKNCPLDKDTRANLLFLIGIRHEIEHQMTDKIDEYISAKLQACAINYDFYITKLFGEKYKLSEELALTIQFSPLLPEQTDGLKDNPHLTTNIKNFVCEFEEHLPQEVMKSSKYAYRVFFAPIVANRAGQADRVVQFIKPDPELAEKIDRIMIKETEKPKYLPKQIVTIMKEKGYSKLTINKHTELRKSKNAKKNSKYGTQVANTWYWYQTWLEEVEKYCREHKQELQ